MSKELFYTDSEGKKQDADLHEEILENPQADYATRKGTANRAKIRGMSDEAILALYGVLPDPDCGIPRDEKGWARKLNGDVLRTADGKPVPASAYDGD